MCLFHCTNIAVKHKLPKFHHRRHCAHITCLTGCKGVKHLKPLCRGKGVIGNLPEIRAWNSLLVKEHTRLEFDMLINNNEIVFKRLHRDMNIRMPAVIKILMDNQRPARYQMWKEFTEKM